MQTQALPLLWLVLILNVVVSMALALALGVGLQRLCTRAPRCLRWLQLLPWRTAAAAVFVATTPAVFMGLQMGLGVTVLAGPDFSLAAMYATCFAMQVGLGTLIATATALVIRSARWSLPCVLAAVLRTALIASVVLLLQIPTVGDDDVSSLAQFYEMFDLEGAAAAWRQALAVLLAIDLGVGLLQAWLFRIDNGPATA